MTDSRFLHRVFIDSLIQQKRNSFVNLNVNNDATLGDDPNDKITINGQATFNNNLTMKGLLTSSSANDLDVITLDKNTNFVDYNNIQNTFYTHIDCTNDYVINPQLSIDMSRNVYMAGIYAGNELNIYDGTNNSVPVGNLFFEGIRALFVTKYDDSGVNHWRTRITGWYAKAEPSIHTSGNGDTFISMQSYDEVDTSGIKIYDVDHVTEPVKLLTSNDDGVANTILVKYTTEGKFDWNCRVKILNTTNFSITSSTVVTGDLSGNVYISGFYPNSDASGSIAIYDSTNDVIPVKIFKNSRGQGPASYFIIKFDSTGKFLWVNHITGYLETNISNSADLFKYIQISIHTDLLNNLYLTSTFNNQCNNKPTLIIYSPNTNNEVKRIEEITINRSLFNIKFDPNGNYLWDTRVFPFSTSFANDGQIQSSNCVDACGNLYTTFTNIDISGYIIQDTSNEQQIPVTINDKNAKEIVSLVKFDTNGRFLWQNYITANCFDGNDIVLCPTITCDNKYINNQLQSHIYLQFTASVNTELGGFNFYKPNTYISGGDVLVINYLDNVVYTLPTKDYYYGDPTLNLILARYDASGNFEWASPSAGYNNFPYRLDEITTSVVADSDGHVYTSGVYYNNLLIWDSSTTDPYSDNKGILENSNSEYKIYLIKYNRYGLLNTNLHRNIYIEDSKLIPDGAEKSIVVTNNNNSGTVECLILEPKAAGFGFQVRKSVILVDSLELVSNNGRWLTKSQVDLPTISNDLGVIDVNTKLSVIDYETLKYTSWYTSIYGTGASNEQNVKMSTDNSGNIIVTGTYDSSTVNFDDLNGNSSSAPKNNGDRSVFVVKYDSNGNGQWSYPIHIDFDTNVGLNTPTVYCDPNGNIYVTIVKTNDASDNKVYIYDSRDANTVQKETLLNSGATIVIKFDSAGIFQWKVRILGYFFDTAGTSDSIAVADSEGNVYINGYQNNSDGIVIIDSTDYSTHLQYGSYGSFLCKFDKSGMFKWNISNLYGVVPNYKSSVACDLDGNIVITGLHDSSIDIYQIVDGEVGLYKTLNKLRGYYGLYMVKYNSDGKVIWANGLYLDTSSSSDQIQYPVTTIDGNGNLFLSAQLYGEYVYIYDTRNPIYDEGHENDYRLVVPLDLDSPGTTNNNIILLKYNKNGIFQWYTFVNAGATQLPLVPSISVDNRFIKGINSANVYLSGTYNNTTIKFYEGSTTDSPGYSGASLAPIGSNDVFIVRYNSEGIFDWVSRTGGTNDETNSSIVATVDGNVYFAGEFRSATIDVYQGWSMDNDPNSTVAVTVYNEDGTGNSYDIFLVKFNRYGILNNSDGENVFGPELFLENSDSIPNGTEKTIIITNNIQYGDNTPENVCLQVLSKFDHGYSIYRTLWFCEGVTMVSYNGKWIMKSSSTGDGLPKRSIVMWGGNQSDIPAGWGLCDGSDHYGISTPDLRGRFVLGYNADVSVASNSTGNRAPINSINNYGGELNHQLTISEMPSHNHSITDPGHSHTLTTYDAGSSQGGIGRNTSTLGSHNPSTNSAQTGITIDNRGGDLPHNNLPPYYVLAFIMKCY